MKISYDPGLVADLLQPGEVFELIVGGRILEAPMPAFRGWLIVVTNQRLLCVKGNRVPRERVIEVPKENITNVLVFRRLFECECRVSTTMGIINMSMHESAATLLRHTLLNSAVRQPGHPMTRYAAPSNAALPHAPVTPAVRPTPTGLSQDQIGQLIMTVERLETDLQQVQAQVEFLENLLTKRATA